MDRKYSVQFRSNNGAVTRPDYQPMTHEQAVAFKSKFSKHPARHVEIYELPRL